MNRAELVKTLELVRPALAANNDPVPVFQCFTFADGTVSAYNDSIGIIGPAKLDDEMAFAIHGQTLIGLLSNSRSEDVFFAMKDQAAILSLGKTTSKLPYQPEENFLFNPPEGKWPHKMPFTESIANAIKVSLGTVSSDQAQPALLGITIDNDRLYSCDGDSLTRFSLKHAIKGRILMPTAFCAAVIKLWSTLNITHGVLYFNDEWAHAYFSDWSVYGRLLEVQSPIDFEALIKSNLQGKTPTLEIPADLEQALSRARVLSDAESQKTVLTVAKGKLKMLTETFMGEIKDELDIKGHPDITANINASHLQGAVQYCDKISILEKCVLLEKAPDVLMIVSNMH